ncbi:alpha- -mannosyltransferase [Fusarium langsethiae]|uniref:Alpha--mannosyltransferase n=1 Tax=Fusarium langsethiae TaxID=179993 RepID=A0A0M9F1F3_FUSLA|nr:alpha- -mannosyltransferase [Fusarium langsethiae]GKU06018.1 unnamed protein product [Fusarium langsethiae]GKU20992.1 unnamed protein product [Fusarium langsethiae]
MPSAGNATKETVWATIDGPRSLASSLRDTLQSLQLFLQDPLHAIKNAPYFNPQRFHNDPNTRTIDFQLQDAPPAPNFVFQDEQVVTENVLDRLNLETDLPETAGSAHLNAGLENHQKQALTFMIDRETGWRLRYQGQDVWSQAINQRGYPVYFNNIESCMHDQCPPNFRGGILADPMGLGKTLSIISLIAHDNDGAKGSEATTSRGETTGRGTLRVLPPSLIQHWEDELAKHLSSEAFAWRRYHGQHQNINVDSISFCDIILATYNTLAKEWQDQDKGQRTHQIKSLSTAKSRAACALIADCRWAVTGTPIQNRLSELFSLIHFLRLSPYSAKKAFDRAFTNPWLQGEGSGFQALTKLLGYIMLRRPKALINLPKREDHCRCLTFSRQEQEAYDIAKKRAVECLDDALDSGNMQEGYRNALEKINALRVVCELGCQPRQSTFKLPETNLLTPS